MLSSIPTTDRYLSPFTGPSSVWSTVTPMILPGFDDPKGWRRGSRNGLTAEEQRNRLERLDRRTLDLIWRGFHQAGWTSDALHGAEVEYRPVGWFRGLDLAGRYEDLPPLKFPRLHIRVSFPRPVHGPLAVGAGRYRGFGLFIRHDG